MLGERGLLQVYQQYYHVNNISEHVHDEDNEDITRDAKLDDEYEYDDIVSMNCLSQVYVPATSN